jgi:hypothetical protein
MGIYIRYFRIFIVIPAQAGIQECWWVVMFVPTGIVATLQDSLPGFPPARE